MDLYVITNFHAKMFMQRPKTRALGSIAPGSRPEELDYAVEPRGAAQDRDAC